MHRAHSNLPGASPCLFLRFSQRATFALAGGGAAVLLSACGAMSPMNFGPPATWEAMDGSKLTATQLAVAPSDPASLPLQLVKANPAMGAGAMQGVTYIQRVALAGGIAPASVCSPANKGAKQTVRYQADYIFWKAA